MTNKVEIQTVNIRLTEKIEEHVNKKAGNLDRYLPAIDEARVQLSHHKAARDAKDRNVAEIMVYGKGINLRSEVRADEVLAAFDEAYDNMQRQIERHKGKHYHGRGDGKSAAEVVEEVFDEDTGKRSPLFAKRKKFTIYPMTAYEALTQMRDLGHDNFFIFYNAETGKINVLYRRRNGSYGLIEPELG